MAMLQTDVQPTQGDTHEAVEDAVVDNIPREPPINYDEFESEGPKSSGKTKKLPTRVLKRKRSQTKRAKGFTTEADLTEALIYMKRKRQDLTLTEKVKVLEMLESLPKIPQGKVASMFNVSQSQISRIQKNKERITKEWQVFANPERKRSRLGKAGHLEQKLLSWYIEAKKEDIPISGPVLMEKAKNIGLELGEEFRPTAGWLGRWKERNGVTFKRFKDKDGTPSLAKMANHWRRYTFTKATKETSPENIWIMGICGLFHKTFLTSLANKLSFTPQVDDRLTVVLTCNLCGTEKRQPLVIGQDSSIVAFKLPVAYSSHSDATLTQHQFSSWLREWDKELQNKKRKIVLFMEQGKFAEDISLCNIAIHFYPPDIRQMLQPFCFGISKIFDALYKHQFLRHFLTVSKLYTKVSQPLYISTESTLLDELYMVDRAWKHISPDTLVKGIVKAGLSKDVQALNVKDKVIPPPGITDTEFEEFEVADFSKKFHSVGVIQENKNFACLKQPESADIENNGVEEQQQTPLPHLPPTVSEAAAACLALRQYLQFKGSDKFTEFLKVEADIQADLLASDTAANHQSGYSNPFFDHNSPHSLEAQEKFNLRGKITTLQRHNTKEAESRSHENQQQVYLSTDESHHQNNKANGHIETLASHTSNKPTFLPQESGSVCLQVPRNNIHTQYLDIHRSNLTSHVNRHDLERQDHHMEQNRMGINSTGRMDFNITGDVPQEHSRNSVMELRNFTATDFRSGMQNMRNNFRPDLKNVVPSVSGMLPAVQTNIHSDIRSSTSGMDIHGIGHYIDPNKDLRAADARVNAQNTFFMWQ